NSQANDGYDQHHCHRRYGQSDLGAATQLGAHELQRRKGDDCECRMHGRARRADRKEKRGIIAVTKATAAIDPDCITAMRPQANKKPSPGPYAFRRKWYSPPKCGYVDPSSA